MAGTTPRAGAQQRRNAGESKFVFVVCGAFIGVVLALSAMQAQAMMTKSKSREAMGGTLEQVSKHQADFRIVYGRYATWQQLEERGEKLDPGIRVTRSNATESHWYLQLFDPGSGLVCDKIHELTTVDASPAKEQCREASTY